jgi:DNA-binding transcriptional LysR family regulator
MKLHQLQCLCTIVDESFSITKAAARLRRSQPGVSKQLKLLERELRTPLLTRRRNRVTGLTGEGAAILPTARQILKGAETLREILAGAGDPKKGRMAIATTHVHARYTLLPIFKRFRRNYLCDHSKRRAVAGLPRGVHCNARSASGKQTRTPRRPASVVPESPPRPSRIKGL